MRVDEIARCVNCGIRPLPFKQKGKYQYKLVHPKTTCPAEFGIETHQHTRDQCIRVWNEHQKKFNKTT